MPGREKGSATIACPTCGKELTAVRQLDGSLAASNCDHGAKPEKASRSTSRERGTDAADTDAGQTEE